MGKPGLFLDVTIDFLQFRLFWLNKQYLAYEWCLFRLGWGFRSRLKADHGTDRGQGHHYEPEFRLSTEGK